MAPSVEEDTVGATTRSTFRPEQSAVDEAPVLGAHSLVDLGSIHNNELLNDAVALRGLFEAASAAGHFTILPAGLTFHQFHPQGVTGMVLLAESHMSIHTWPEFHAAAVDIFTCGPRHRPRVALQVILDALQPGTVNVTTVQRPVAAHSRWMSLELSHTSETHQRPTWTSPCCGVALVVAVYLLCRWVPVTHWQAARTKR
eukprot:GGOE01061040.1.p1 GENE.GGOE01061040.1~~GGOE01061040.1.p1  ORF type:complete len:200 (+),score=20.37 GGOE01061040.1:55-654(+)